MEVKDLTNSVSGAGAGGKQRSLKVLPRVSPVAIQENSNSLENGQGSSTKAEAALAQADALISEISNGAESINSYVKSLGGIIEQGLRETSGSRKQALEKEANQVFNAIREKAILLKQSEGQAVAADPVRSKVEARIGRTLEILFPEDEEPKGGIPEISFNNKDLIISVQTKILKTSQYLDSLREEKKAEKEEVKEVIKKAEIAQLNAESSRASLRDLDSAIKLVEETSKAIGSDSKTAMFAIGSLIREQIDVTG